MWALADKRWGFEKNPTNLVLILKIFTFGSVTYGLLITLRYFGWLPDISEFVKEAVVILSGETENIPSEYELLVLSIPTSAVLTLIWLFLVNVNAFTLLLLKIRVIQPSRLVSFMESALDCPPNSKLVVRIMDVDSGRSYKGELDSFEESPGVIKLLLLEVEISDFSGKVVDKSERFIYSCATNKLQYEVITLKEKK